jgi:pSer/pThr/pTyr-binding forkhead associated (FHA) protein
VKVVLRLQTNNMINEVTLEPNKPLTFGRSSKCDMKVTDELMSGSHCRINYVPPKLEITDLDSKNGTYLNGIRVEQSEVFLGDEIRVGSTKITILTERMENKAIQALTFPGAAKDRAAHELKLDFTGARQMNQSYFTSAYGPKSTSTSQSIHREIEVRKQAKSKIKLSKFEIKQRNKVRASMASTIDIVLLIMAAGVPLILTNLAIVFNPTLLQNYRLPVMLFSEIVFVGFYFLFNFKVLKFTFGEKLAGIQELYSSQE